MSRVVRYQAAIVRGQELLLIRHQEHESGRSYWLLPGGGREPGESEEECVRREVLEETHLTVKVERLLLEQADLPAGAYEKLRTYLCTPLSGEAAPGYEPELEAAAWYAIVETSWIDLTNPLSWDRKLADDPYTLPQVKQIRKLLGLDQRASSA